jgi:hypothetical protein
LKKYRLLIAIALAVVLVMACNLPDAIINSIQYSSAEEGDEVSKEEMPGENILSPEGIVTEAPGACLAGTWEITGIHEYVLAAIPQEMAEEYNLEYKGTNGSVYFILTPDGQAVMQADELEIVLEAQASIFTVPVTASLDGEAVGRYTANGGVLTTTGMDTSGLSASAQAMGQELASSEQILRAIPMLKPPANSAEYICEGDTLSMRVDAYPTGVPPLEFVRVE